VATVADPTEETKEGQLDPEYAAGEAAIAAKDWPTAIRLLSSAALRDTRNADIENYLGYAYRQSRQLPPSHITNARCSSILAIAAPTSTSARRTS